MKKITVSTLILFSYFTFAQSTAMIALVLNDGKESDYLEKEKNWNVAAQAMVDAGMIAQWSVWKRTPRDGDNGWAHYYVFRRTTAEQDANSKNYDKLWDVIYKAFRGQSKKQVDKMLGFKGIFKDRRERQFKWVSTTGWLGLEWKIGDKCNFHFMTQKNADFLSYEDQLWKPVAQKQILDGFRKFWGLGEIISKDEGAKKLKTGFTHIAFNFMTEKKGESTFDVEDDFLAKKAWEGLNNSREILPAEELTLIYSTF